MKKRILALFTFVSTLCIFLFFESAHAYPLLVRHGYVNCSTCHVSPTGGGILSKYGREISADLVSQASEEGEAQFLSNIVELPANLDAGGDVKVLGYFDKEPLFTDKRILLMEAEGQLAYKPIESLTAVAAGGFYGTEAAIKTGYLLYQINDSSSVRAGLFTPAFGVNTPEHNIATRDGLGFSSAKSSYNIEYAQVGESNSAYVTVVAKQGEGPGNEFGVALRDELHIKKEHQLGLSYYIGKRSAFLRNVVGPFAVLTLTKTLSFITEEDLQYMAATKTDATTKSHLGFFNYNTLDWEMTRGLHAYAVQDFGKTDINDHYSQELSYGIGLQYFPRPHFEINTSLRRQRTTLYSNAFGNLAWLVLHYYL